MYAAAVGYESAVKAQDESARTKVVKTVVARKAS
jgi:hypothetical protein